MPTITLTEAQQEALRSLMAIQPAADRPVPPLEVLRHLDSLVPCDAMGVVVVDDDGSLVEQVVLPHSAVALQLHLGEPEPVHVGVVHWGRHGAEAEACGALDGVQDGITVGFRNACGAVGQVWLERERCDFTDDDVVRLQLVVPILRRLLCASPPPHLPRVLTVQEQRVLLLVADGMSNAEIAARLFVSVCTVRKHLENAYRKLGVHNRMAAVVALEGGPTGRHEPVATAPKFA